MAGQMIRRWNTFYGAFDHVDDAIEAADLHQPRHAPVSTELAESVRALREHDSERVRLLARGIVSGWEASVQDDVAEVTPATPMKRLEKVSKVTPAMKKLPQPKAAVGQQQDVSANPNAETKRPPKLAGEPLAKKTMEIIKKASDPAAGFVDGDRAGLSLEDKMEVLTPSSARVDHYGYVEWVHRPW
ncbi:hypothetical protein ZWY2020_059222 [Hordeum vulgare]|nr:hypothetical protein ZWY2020_059222 [Hordeum vulgare]